MPFRYGAVTYGVDRKHVRVPAVGTFRVSLKQGRRERKPRIDMIGSRVMPDSAVRIDRWLLATRLFKTRGAAQQACTGGRVKLNGHSAKPSSLVKCGDEVRAESPRGLVVWIVRELAERRQSAELARQLYDDHSPPPPPKEERVDLGIRERGAGRPTKADRRALERLRRET